MIIKSILDTDLYKFTTSYAYMKLFPQARGTFEFIDRDNTEYPEDFIERLYLELGSLGMLHLAKDEQEYMNNNCRFIPPVYWEWLSSFKFNSGKIQASLDENGHLHIKVTDYLYKVTLYEVPILAIVSELRSRIFDNNCDLADVIKRLSPKIKLSNVAGKLIPTDGLGISNSDLEQIGAKDYATVDDILSRFIPFKEYRQKHGEPLHPHDEMAESDCWSQLCARHGEDVVNKVWGRHLASEFKRKKAPIYISRKLYE